MYDLVKIHQILDDHFTLDEFRTLCFQLGVDADDLEAIGQSGKARELVQHLDRRGRTAELVGILAQERPHLDLAGLKQVNYRRRLRPAMPGSSISHFRGGAATFGCLVIDREAPHQVYILCDTSGLAPSEVTPQPGDPVIQPGHSDGGHVNMDAIGTLDRWAPLSTKTRHVDRNVSAALARVNRLEDVSAQLADGRFLNGVRPAHSGMVVQGNGRTNAKAVGTIQQLRRRFQIPWSPTQVTDGQSDRHGFVHITFTNVIVCNYMIAPGDSGMVLRDNENYAIGLGFAGNDRESLFMPMQKVLDALNLDLVTEATWEQIITRQEESDA